MPPLFDALIVLLIVMVVARWIKRGSPVLQRYFIPSSLVGGVGALLLGPQILEAIPPHVTDIWAQLPKHLISVVFAGLFIGHAIPGPRTIWQQAGPMIAFGNTLAWGQYVIGIALALFLLVPVFGAHPLSGALIEIGFEGGHGTAAGLAPTFEMLGWPEATDIALGLATISIITMILSGVLMINIHNRMRGQGNNDEAMRIQQRRMVRSGYSIVKFVSGASANPKLIAGHLLLFALAISLGWLLLQGFIWVEDLILAPFTDLRFFVYVPLFPLAMVGGLIIQLLLMKFHKTHWVNRRMAGTISAIALDLLIMTAIATVSLSVIGANLPVFLTLAIAGIVWILAAFFFFAPRMFQRYWFEQGLTNTGQSMGMTATGLLLNRLVDPTNKSHAREAFAYKQLAFEPFMGGGLITATAAIIIAKAGMVPALIGASVIFVFWVWLGLRMGHKPQRRKHN